MVKTQITTPMGWKNVYIGYWYKAESISGLTEGVIVEGELVQVENNTATLQDSNGVYISVNPATLGRIGKPNTYNSKKVICSDIVDLLIIHRDVLSREQLHEIKTNIELLIEAELE